MQLGMIGGEATLVEQYGTLFERVASRGDLDYANHPLSVVRQQFSGHDEKAS